MNNLILSAINILAGLIFGSDENGMSIFDRITGVVKRWGEKQIYAEDSGAVRRHGAMADIGALDGFVLSEQLTRLGIELAVRLLRLKGG